MGSALPRCDSYTSGMCPRYACAPFLITFNSLPLSQPEGMYPNFILPSLPMSKCPSLTVPLQQRLHWEHGEQVCWWRRGLAPAGDPAMTAYVPEGSGGQEMVTYPQQH